MKLKRHRLFIKDFRSLTLADSQFDKLIYFLSVLRKGDPLPEESKDHALLGEWSDFREFHIGGGYVGNLSSDRGGGCINADWYTRQVV